MSPPFQVIELAVSERDIEKEHLSQLRRWKETHGELHCKSPPRMHGAKAIMAAEPPSRQDLKQNPTIIVEEPQTTESKTEKDKKLKRQKRRRQKTQKAPLHLLIHTCNPATHHYRATTSRPANHSTCRKTRPCRAPIRVSVAPNTTPTCKALEEGRQCWPLNVYSAETSASPLSGLGIKGRSHDTTGPKHTYGSHNHIGGWNYMISFQLCYMIICICVCACLEMKWRTNSQISKWSVTERRWMQMFSCCLVSECRGHFLHLPQETTYVWFCTLNEKVFRPTFIDVFELHI